MATVKVEKLDDYLGIPIHKHLKRRIEKLGAKKTPIVRTVPMARSLLERAVESAERETAAK